MKAVTIVISSLAGGGAEGVCVSIANALANLGWAVNLVVLHNRDPFYLERVNTKVNIINLNVHRARNSLVALLRYIIKNKPKQILSFNYELTVILLIIRSIFSFKIKIISRNINVFSKLIKHSDNTWKKLIINPLVKYFYGKSDYIINQCKAMREDLIDVYPHIKELSCVINNPVATHIEEYKLDSIDNTISKQPYFLCIGRLENQKAFDYAIKAFANISNEYPNLKLKIVGQGTLKNELQELIKLLNIDDKVSFEGLQTNVIDYYIKAEATILSSLYEGFPNVLIESISLGTPVVAFDCKCGPSEIIIDGVNGYLVDYLNIEALSDGLRKILNIKMHRKDVIETSKKYNMANIIEQYQAILITPNI